MLLIKKPLVGLFCVVLLGLGIYWFRSRWALYGEYGTSNPIGVLKVIYKNRVAKAAYKRALLQSQQPQAHPPARKALIADAKPTNTYSKNEACQNFAALLKDQALQPFAITEGSFHTSFGETLPRACSFSVSCQADTVLDKSGWILMPKYQADGPDGGSYAIENGKTVCFVDHRIDTLDDDATPEQEKAWKRGPDQLTIACTDKEVFDKIDRRKQ